MIGSIRGLVIYIGSDYILIDNHGIGYRVFFNHLEKIKLNEEIFVFTYLQVREDDLSLYGFLSKEEYDLFIRLISVKGLGAKIASNILKRATVSEIIKAIEEKDINFIKSLPGIGNKTASQIVLDLKGKLIDSAINDIDDGKLKQVSEALKNFGFKPNEIRPILSKLKDIDGSDDVLLRKALNLLNKNRG